MSTRLGEAHYQFTIDDEGLVAGLKRARARARTEAAAMAADIRRVGASFDAISQRSGRAARQVEADMRRIRSAQRERGAGEDDVRSGRQGRGRRVRSNAGNADGLDGAGGDRPSRGMGAAKLASGIADTFSSIGSGMSPAMAALKHGPQLLEAMAQAGLRLGPVGAIVTALAGGILVLGANALRTERDLKTFAGQIEASAHGSHYNAEALAEVSRAMDIQGASADEARQATSLFLNEGVHPERLNEFGTAATYLSQVMGMDMVGAATAVSAAFTGNYDDVVKLDDSLHFLTDSEKKHIQTLFDSGKASEARNEAFKIFTDRYATAYSASLTEADRLTRNLSGAWESLVERIGNTTAVEAATKAIGDLVNQLATWMLRFVDIKRMTQDQLMAENKRLTRDIVADSQLLEKMKQDGTYDDRDLDGIQWGKVIEERIARNKGRAGEIVNLTDPHIAPQTTDTTVTPPPKERRKSSAAVGDNTNSASLSVLLQELKTDEEKARQTFLKNVNLLDGALAAGKLSRAAHDEAMARLEARARFGSVSFSVSDGKGGEKRMGNVFKVKARNPDDDVVLVKPWERNEPDLVPFEESLKDIPRLATPIKDMAFEIGTSFSDAFGRAVAGMTTFEEAFKSTLQNMVAKWASSGFEKILGMLIGGNAAQDAGYGRDGIFGGGGIFGRGGDGGASGGWMMNLMDFAGFRAGGGPVEAGRAYVVGEKRPELFVPRVSGTILPHVNAAAGGPMIVRVEVDKSKYFDVHVNAVSARNARAAAGRAVEIANQTAYGSVRRSDTYEAA